MVPVSCAITIAKCSGSRSVSISFIMGLLPALAQASAVRPGVTCFVLQLPAWGMSGFCVWGSIDAQQCEAYHCAHLDEELALDFCAESAALSMPTTACAHTTISQVLCTHPMARCGAMIPVPAKTNMAFGAAQWHAKLQ